MEPWKKSTSFGHYKSNTRHENILIGNTSEGQGFADKRKRKILSHYKKLMRKTRISESNVGTDHPLTHHVPAADSKDTIDQVEEKYKEETKHYRKNEQRRNTKSVYTKDKVKFQRKGSRKQSEGDTKKKGLNRYSNIERLRQKEIKEHHTKLQEKAARRQSREEALKKYREKKEATHKKMSKRTARGQPVIKYQMEYLLQKIQSQSTR